jgi:hypothetical protein
VCEREKFIDNKQVPEVGSVQHERERERERERVLLKRNDHGSYRAAPER